MAPVFSSRAKGFHRHTIGFVPAKLVPDPEMTPDPIRPASSGAIEIEFAAGIRMRITGAVDGARLKAAVAAWRMDERDDPDSKRRQGLDRDRPHRHAPRHAKPGAAGSG